MDRSLSSPNHIVWEYFACLKRQAQRAALSGERLEQQETSLTIFMAVTVVEVFLNLYLRVVVSELPYKAYEQEFVQDLKSRIPLERKLRKWPRMIFGDDIDFEERGIGDFVQLKDIRNSLVHFVSSHDSIELPGPVIVHGLADTSVYSSLSVSLASKCPDIVRSFAYEIFRLRGIDKDKRSHSFHAWFGEPPSNSALQPTRANDGAVS